MKSKFIAALDSLATLAEYLEEAHQEEIDSNHAGDGMEGCSYCAAIAHARQLVAAEQPQPAQPVTYIPNAPHLPQYQREFRGYPDLGFSPGELPVAFDYDVSYHNDACPSWATSWQDDTPGTLLLYVEWPEREKRDTPDTPRFHVVRVTSDDRESLFTCELLDSLRLWLKRYQVPTRAEA